MQWANKASCSVRLRGKNKHKGEETVTTIKLSYAIVQVQKSAVRYCT